MPTNIPDKQAHYKSQECTPDSDYVTRASIRPVEGKPGITHLYI
jgi:hypothetical protein